MHEMFAQLRFAELIRPAMVPVFSQATAELAVFRNWREPAANMYIGPLIMAATSAPTYFSVVRFSGDNRVHGLYSDAGIVLDSPAEYAFMSAVDMNPDAEYVVVSVGTNRITNVNTRIGVHAGILGWVNPLLSMALNGQKHHSRWALQRMQLLQKSFRLNPFRFAPSVPWAWDTFDGSKKNIDRLKRAGANYVTDHQQELEQALRLLQDRTD